MHAEKKFANSRPLFSLPTVLYKMAVQLKGFANPIMFGNAYQQISFLGTSHVACSIIWYQVYNSSPCCSSGWWGIELKIMWNLLDEAGDINIYLLFLKHIVYS